MPRPRKFVPIKLSEEDQLQRAICDHWRMRGEPNSVLAAIPNGGARSISTAVRMKLTGALAGMPDLIAVAGGKTLFIELKAKRGGLSAAQRETIPRLKAAGVVVMVSKNIDEVLTVLEGWGVLKPEARPA